MRHIPGRWDLHSQFLIHLNFKFSQAEQSPPEGLGVELCDLNPR